MKPIGVRRRKSLKLPVAWQAAEYAALRFNAADTCDDRVSDDIFDVDDEHAEVGLIVSGLQHGVH